MKNVFLALLIILASSTFATTIYDIQYTTDPGADGTYPSPLNGEDVTVTGIVTAVGYYSSGSTRFFISDPDGGAWHGIFVFSSDSGLQLGMEVEVTGTVTEYYGFTEIGYATVSILGEGNPVPDPVVVTTNDLASNEAYEGVLTRINNVTVSQLPDSYGQWYVNDGSGECQIDDAIFSYTPEEGQTFDSITGVVDYSYGEYGLNPRNSDDLGIEVPFTAIYDIQYTTDAGSEGTYPSPLEGQTVRVTGIVTATDMAVKNFSFLTLPAELGKEFIFLNIAQTRILEMKLILPEPSRNIMVLPKLEALRFLS